MSRAGRCGGLTWKRVAVTSIGLGKIPWGIRKKAVLGLAGACCTAWEVASWPASWWGAWLRSPIRQRPSSCSMSYSFGSLAAK